MNIQSILIPGMVICTVMLSSIVIALLIDKRHEEHLLHEKSKQQIRLMNHRIRLSAML